jgi:multidrug efflux system membrane fusion protein
MNRVVTLLLAVLFGTVLATGCQHKPSASPAAPPGVDVSQPVEREVTDHVEFTGRTDAAYFVEVRARVRGYLIKVNFKDGQRVKKGDVLYEIDPRPYQADLDKAKGQLAQAEGQKQVADIQVARYTNLVAKDAASAQSLDEWRGKQAEAIGNVAAAKGQLEGAKLNLDFCTVTVPIDGQIGRTFFQIGNLISPDTTVLTTIASIEPMYAYFNVDEPTLLRVVKRIRSGQLGTVQLDKIPVRMGLADDTERKFPLRGNIDFVNNLVDKLTATITLRGTFKNPSDPEEGKPPLLKPGMFARVRVPLGRPHKALLVNERAIGTDQGYKFVYTVDETNQVHYRRVTLGQVEDGLQVIEEGLKAGEWVVVQGLQRCRAGATVQPEKVDMVTLQSTDPKGTEASKP